MAEKIVGIPLIPELPPPVAFHYLVVFYGVALGPVSLPAPNPIDLRFQQVSGMSATFPGEKSVNFGSRKVQLPERPTFSNLVLERGYLLPKSPLRDQIENTFESMKFQPWTVHVLLLGPDSLPLTSWLFHNAFPVTWTIGNLNANNSEVLIETLEISYSHFKTTFI